MLEEVYTMSSPDRAVADWPMPRWAKFWTEEEIALMRKLASSHTAFALAKELGRSPAAVWVKASDLGIKLHTDRWQNRSRRNGH